MRQHSSDPRLGIRVVFLTGILGSVCGVAAPAIAAGRLAELALLSPAITFGLLPVCILNGLIWAGVAGMASKLLIGDRGPLGGWLLPIVVTGLLAAMPGYWAGTLIVESDAIRRMTNDT